MGIDIKEALRIAKHFNEKKTKGEALKKGEEVILTLASEYVRIIGQDVKVSDDLCADIITVHKKRIKENIKTSTHMDNMELNMLLDGLMERLYIK